MAEGIMSESPMRHYEVIRGRNRLFWRLGIDSRVVKMCWGRVANGEECSELACATEEEARRTMERWIRRLLATGYAEVELPRGSPGEVRWVEGSRGPGWIRLDTRQDVHYEPGSVEPPELEIGMRVIVQAPRPYDGPDANTVHKGKLEAGQVVAFPEMRRRKAKKMPDPDERTRAALAKLAERDTAHPQQDRDFKVGDIVFAWEKGVHRLLKVDDQQQAHFDPLFTSNFKWRLSPVLTCHIQFCTKVSPELRDRIESLEGEAP
jgi:hypothetical protein